MCESYPVGLIAQSTSQRSCVLFPFKPEFFFRSFLRNCVISRVNNCEYLSSIKSFIRGSNLCFFTFIFIYSSFTGIFNLVPRVLWLFGQRVGDRRDSIWGNGILLPQDFCATLFPGLFPSMLGGAGKDPGNGRSRDHQTPEKLGCYKLAIA